MGAVLSKQLKAIVNLEATEGGGVVPTGAVVDPEAVAVRRRTLSERLRTVATAFRRRCLESVD